MKKLLLTLLMFVSFLNANAQSPIQEFNFNGNLNNKDNSISFLGTPNFVNDRLGVGRGALRLTNKAFQAVVGDLPQDNKPRSISIWIKFNAITTSNDILGYGSAANGQYFGLLQQVSTNGNSDLSLAGWGAGNDIIVSVPLEKEVWYQYTITYDGNTSKIYRNGELLKSVDGISRSTKGYILNLGKINTTVSINADIDELKLYSVAMTDEQVKQSYTSSKAATTTTVTETAQASNAAKKTASTVVAKTAPVANETNKGTGTKKIEIFSQGKQVMGSNATNIGDLPEGTYLLKITNTSSK
ncbi:LamG domain-containing protein [Flavobacterium sp. MC2016-06]|uniref:LamG domain-containing protein n=1 Tax=Flavobacterium sp. MC2016-06 TaxID=2676308 RepID=UPI0012BAEE24|nr:LamG domain-containing protein [Flavobacterium sp. MC2016-06]MBU3859854.1 LamG domain-containing protein [Flavobacterium sp. MC2016-06]